MGLRSLFESILSPASFVGRYHKHAWVAFGCTFLIWLYADLVEQRPLDRDEVLGALLLSFFLSLCIAKLVGWFRRAVMIISLSALCPLVTDAHSALQVFDIPRTAGTFEFDLRQPSIYRFPYELGELDLQNGSSSGSSSPNCLRFTTRAVSGQILKFCGFEDAFQKGIGSLIVGSDGRAAYAYNLDNLESGGGGDIPALFEIPNTRLTDYMAATALKIELLARSVIPSDHKNFKGYYTGFGLYGFVLFRDPGRSNSVQKEAVVRAIEDTFQDVFDVDMFGVPRNRMGVLMIPSTLDNAQIYDAVNTGDHGDLWMLSRYNYDYAAFALRSLQNATRVTVPAVSIVFVSGESLTGKGQFYLSKVDWSEAIIFDLSSATAGDISSLILAIRNELIFDYKYAAESSESIGLFARVRTFVGSTGRFASLVVDVLKD